MTWTLVPGHEPPPAPLPVPLYPISPAWKAWLDEQEAAAVRVALPGYGRVASVSISFEVSEFVFAVSGDTPGPWIKEDKTFTTNPPAEHMDFTRYKRVYANIVLQKYKRIVVTVTIVFVGMGPIKYYFIFWDPIGGPDPAQNYVVYRWKQTSGIRSVAGVPGTWYDGSTEEWTSVEPWESDLVPSGDPPKGLLEPPVPEVNFDPGGTEQQKK